MQDVTKLFFSLNFTHCATCFKNYLMILLLKHCVRINIHKEEQFEYDLSLYS